MAHTPHSKTTKITTGEHIKANGQSLGGAQFTRGEQYDENQKLISKKIYGTFIRGTHDEAHGISLLVAEGLGLDVGDVKLFSLADEGMADFLIAPSYSKTLNPLHYDEVNPSNAFMEMIYSDLYLVAKQEIIKSADKSQKALLKDMFKYPTLKKDAIPYLEEGLDRVFPTWRDHLKLLCEAQHKMWCLGEVLEQHHPDIFKPFRLVADGEQLKVNELYRDPREGKEGAYLTGPLRTEPLQNATAWEQNPESIHSDVFDAEKLRFQILEHGSRSRKLNMPFKIQDILDDAGVSYTPETLERIVHSEALKPFSAEQPRYVTMFNRARRDKGEQDIAPEELEGRFYIDHASRLNFIFALMGALDPQSIADVVAGDHTYEITYGLDMADLPTAFVEAKKDPEVAALVSQINSVLKSYPVFFREGELDPKEALAFKAPDLAEITGSDDPVMLSAEIKYAQYFLSRIVEADLNHYGRDITTPEYRHELENRTEVRHLLGKVRAQKAELEELHGISDPLLNYCKTLDKEIDRIVEKFPQVGSLLRELGVADPELKTATDRHITRSTRHLNLSGSAGVNLGELSPDEREAFLNECEVVGDVKDVVSTEKLKFENQSPDADRPSQAQRNDRSPG